MFYCRDIRSRAIFGVGGLHGVTALHTRTWELLNARACGSSVVVLWLHVCVYKRLPLRQPCCNTTTVKTALGPLQHLCRCCSDAGTALHGVAFREAPCGGVGTPPNRFSPCPAVRHPGQPVLTHGRPSVPIWRAHGGGPDRVIYPVPACQALAIPGPHRQRRLAPTSSVCACS